LRASCDSAPTAQPCATGSTSKVNAFLVLVLSLTAVPSGETLWFLEYGFLPGYAVIVAFNCPILSSLGKLWLFSPFGYTQCRDKVDNRHDATGESWANIFGRPAPGGYSGRQLYLFGFV
jgi:hypothetical protein